MSSAVLGELVPVGGGDPIPLAQPVMSVGRRETNDICLKFQNISSRHCEFTFQDGYWLVKDLGSSNGVKVNGGDRTTRRPLKPGDEITIATHRFTIQYTLQPGNKLSEALAEEDETFGSSLMEKAGLEKPKRGRG